MSTGHVLASEATSGLNINLHPLPILNISEHYNRARLAAPPGSKLIGALLGTQVNREVSVVNSFELTYSSRNTVADVVMSEGSAASNMGRYVIDNDFFEKRKEQFKQVFPSLEVIGWYSVGEEPSADDVSLQQQLASSIDTPIFLLFTSTPPGSQDLPFKVFESALREGGQEIKAEGKFVELEYAVETGEAERIAVDGVSRGDMGGGEEDSVVGNLNTQRNAIRMLYERIIVLVQYVDAVLGKTVEADYTLLRQISALVATLPTMDGKGFQDELTSEYGDVRLAAYLTTLTKQLSALSEYSDKHYTLYPAASEEMGQGPSRTTRGFARLDYGGRRRG